MVRRNYTDNCSDMEFHPAFDRIGWKSFMSRARPTNQRQQTFRYGSARIWSFVFHLESVYAVVIVLNTNQCRMIIIKIFLFYFRCRPKSSMLNEQLMDINARHARTTSAGRNLFMRPQKCVTTTENSNMSTSNDLIRFCALIPLQITHQHIITLCASQSFRLATTTPGTELNLIFGHQSIGVIFDLSHYRLPHKFD